MGMPRDERQADLFRPLLEKVINIDHPLVKLANRIDWDFIEKKFGTPYVPGPGQPRLPARLIAGEASGGLKSDPSSPLPRGFCSARPICEPFAGSPRRPWPRPSRSARPPKSCAPTRLDYVASTEHSYARSSGPLSKADVSTTSASLVRTGWTTC